MFGGANGLWLGLYEEWPLVLVADIAVCNWPRGVVKLEERLQAIHWLESPVPYWAHGVVVSHPLRMRKALGSNPSVSILPRWLRALGHSICTAPNASTHQPYAHLRSYIQLRVA